MGRELARGARKRGQQSRQPLWAVEIWRVILRFGGLCRGQSDSGVTQPSAFECISGDSAQGRETQAAALLLLFGLS